MKFQVLEPKSLSKLHDIIDSRYASMTSSIVILHYISIQMVICLMVCECILYSQLPDFLGGSCKCPGEGGCLRSSKGPWNDPNIMKVMLFYYHLEISTA
jgi:hypothetical protein